jgi:hypothetical protein
MYKMLAAAVGLLLIPGTTFAQTISPAPMATGIGSSYLTSLIAVDPDGALGQNYLVLKGNDDMRFIKRPSGGFSGFYAPPESPDPHYQGDPEFWGFSINSSQIIAPSGIAVPSGTIDIFPGGDAHIVYDSHDPCGDGKGRWLFVELIVELWPDGTFHNGLGIAVSQGEDPFVEGTNGNPGTIAPWTRFYVVSASTNVEGADVDYPQIGFNQNWIGVTTNFFFADSTGAFTEPLAFVFQRQPIECNGTIPSTASNIPVCGNATSTKTLGQGQYWYCNDTSRFLNAAPAETYYTNGNDTSPGLLFARSDPGIMGLGIAGSVKIEQISGSANSPVLMSEQTASVTNPSFQENWEPILPVLGLPQAGAGAPNVQVGPLNDRFTQCVVRNQALWCTQTIGLPVPLPNSTAVQWWQIDLSSISGNTRKVLDLEQIGGPNQEDANLENTMSSGIAVNESGSVVVGYSALNNTSLTSAGYLDASYVFKGHSQCAEDQQVRYESGLGSYYDPALSPPQLRTGDFGHTQVDPLDDSSFFTTSGFAGAPIATPTSTASPPPAPPYVADWMGVRAVGGTSASDLRCSSDI